MKKLLMLLCLILSLAAFTATASAQSYIVAIHGATYQAPEGFEMKGYASTKSDSLDGLTLSMVLNPTINTSASFIGNTDFKLNISLALKDEHYQNIEHITFKLDSLFNYVSHGNGIFGLKDLPDTPIVQTFELNGNIWNFVTTFEKKTDNNVDYYYTMNTTLRDMGPLSTPAPAAILLLVPGIAGIALLRKRIK